MKPICAQNSCFKRVPRNPFDYGTTPLPRLKVQNIDQILVGNMCMKKDSDSIARLPTDHTSLLYVYLMNQCGKNPSSSEEGEVEGGGEAYRASDGGGGGIGEEFHGIGEGFGYNKIPSSHNYMGEIQHSHTVEGEGEGEGGIGGFGFHCRWGIVFFFFFASSVATKKLLINNIL
ncbi:hypothetical protein ACJX0J_027475, partial [Zea mays]